MNKNKDSLILGADTQLTFDNGFKMTTHKIIFNEQYRICFAFCGDIAYRRLNEDTFQYLESILYDAMHKYRDFSDKSLQKYHHTSSYFAIRPIADKSIKNANNAPHRITALQYMVFCQFIFMLH